MLARHTRAAYVANLRYAVHAPSALRALPAPQWRATARDNECRSGLIKNALSDDTLKDALDGLRVHGESE